MPGQHRLQVQCAKDPRGAHAERDDLRRRFGGALLQEVAEAEPELADHLHLEASRIDGKIREMAFEDRVLSGKRTKTAEGFRLDVDPGEPVNKEEGLPVGQDQLDLPPAPRKRREAAGRFQRLFPVALQQLLVVHRRGWTGIFFRRRRTTLSP